MPFEITVPHIYKQLANNDPKLYLKYIRGYVRALHPGFKVKTLIPHAIHLADKVLCEEPNKKSEVNTHGKV